VVGGVWVVRRLVQAEQVGRRPAESLGLASPLGQELAAVFDTLLPAGNSNIVGAASLKHTKSTTETTKARRLRGRIKRIKRIKPLSLTPFFAYFAYFAGLGPLGSAPESFQIFWGCHVVPPIADQVSTGRPPVCLVSNLTRPALSKSVRATPIWS